MKNMKVFAKEYFMFARFMGYYCHEKIPEGFWPLHLIFAFI